MTTAMALTAAHRPPISRRHRPRPPSLRAPPAASRSAAAPPLVSRTVSRLCRVTNGSASVFTLSLAELRGADQHRSPYRQRPYEPAPLQPLGVQ